MPRRMLSAAATGLAVALLAVGCGARNALVEPPPPLVRIATPVKKSVKTYLDYTGIAKAVATVELRARVKGFLTQKNFDETRNQVSKDQLLLVIEEAPYQAQVDQAQARLDAAKSALRKSETSKAREVATAQLALDQASLLLAKIEDARQRSLVQRNAASQQDVDRAEATTRKSAAQVEADQANLEQARSDFDVNILSAKADVAAAEAALADAKINLGYCRITAPVAGRISRTSVDVGNLVGDGQATLLATILSDDPIYAYMSVSESDLLRFRAQVSAGSRPDFRETEIPLELGLADEVGFPHKGKIQYVDPGVDPTTGTTQARGIFPNPGNKIVSGSFVRVRVPYEDKPDALLVPERALGSEGGLPPSQRVLMVVDTENKARRRIVTIGSQADGMRIVESGLKVDDRVVIDGIQKARDDQPVNPEVIDLTKPETPAASPKATGH